ncbi:cation:proton antiporter [Lacticigenium naphthae]|uniref:cation:proton antiporter n=1 Tax=Lacticigenium naphthae TaxID=515351 RepID=UPI0003FE4909|nr:cation:proton antiporter [Lacticigenium naphthae]
MLTSLALIFLTGTALGGIFSKVGLPRLIGMLLTGMLLGPFALNLLDESILSISSELRELALVIILTRAGLALNTTDLKKIGIPAFLMAFIPALFEIAAIVLIAPLLFDLTYIEAALMGTVVAAVSPAVIVPKMIKIKEEGYGQKNRIPQLILAGASLDDIFVIVLFSSFLTVASGSAGFEASQFLEIPVTILLGIVFGFSVGMALVYFFKKVHLRDSAKVIIILSLSFLLLAFEDQLQGFFSFSGLLAIMSLGVTLNQFYPVLAVRLEQKYNKIWVGAEILLFVLVGATVDIQYALAAGFAAFILIMAALVFRAIGVALSLVPSALSKKEKLFTIIGYMPKATVQAAIGGVPLAYGLESGNTILTVAVLAILITAPLGAFGIDLLYKRLLD